MDGNKNEALKCLKITKGSIELGNKSCAIKFLNKARRLDPSIEIDEFLLNLNNGANNSSNANREPSNSSKEPKEGLHRRVSATRNSAASSTFVAYTEEQVAAVREVKRKKDYYEILGLEKTYSVEDVGKAYRKLSLKVLGMEMRREKETRAKVLR